MGKAGQALKQTLKTYGISQNKLAVTIGVERWMVFRWFHEKADPTGEKIVEIVKALKEIEPTAAKTFIDLYLGDLVEDEDQPTQESL